ncbi:GGDEF domain-containing protein [Elstera litoralis]|uniref:GGDEF domain-containing protein n=1 Tax=Elstera litoralis TaxID=552518 RepID=UPI0012ED3698|nr:GGDEF domain-containing protein [Elstera litoralis]
MPPALRRMLDFLALPGAALLAALLFQQAAEPEWGNLFAALPWLVCLAGAAIAWRFRVGNMVMVFVALGAIHALLEQTGRAPFTADTLRFGAAWYWPIMVACLATLPERGLFNRPGLERVAFIVYPALIILAHAANGQPTPFWLRTLLVEGAARRLYLPDTALVFTLIAAGCLLWQFRRRATPLETGLLTVLLLGMVGIALGDSRVYRAIYFSTAGAALIVALIQNSYRVAFHDELTGLPGRRALKSLLNTVGERYVIAMLDVDHFKKFNDTYGHDVGDQVLCRVGRVIANVTGGGHYFRYGGEEFTVVFPNRSLREALPHLDAVCSAMAATPFTVRSKDRPEAKPDGSPSTPDPTKAAGTQVTITISIGAAEKSPRYADWEAVMKAADQALYKAKQAGRNRVMADGQK